jgi:hypothetical protein
VKSQKELEKLQLDGHLENGKIMKEKFNSERKTNGRINDRLSPV